MVGFEEKPEVVIEIIRLFSSTMKRIVTHE